MLIGLTGHAGAGKDSAAAVLCAGGWHSIAFADALRLEVTAAWGIDQRLLTDRKHKDFPALDLCAGGAANTSWLRWVSVNAISLIEPRSPRWVMQQWGSFRRHADPLHWVRAVAYWVCYQRQHGICSRMLHFVIDVKFANQFDRAGIAGQKTPHDNGNQRADPSHTQNEGAMPKKKRDQSLVKAFLTLIVKHDGGLLAFAAHMRVPIYESAVRIVPPRPHVQLEERRQTIPVRTVHKLKRLPLQHRRSVVILHPCGGAHDELHGS